MNIVLMQEERDCAVAAIGTALSVIYEQAAKALNHANLPGPLESPLLSNPWTLYRAISRLGFWKKNLTWMQVKSCEAMPGKIIMLVKQDLLTQHWIVWDGTLNANEGKFHRVFWGNSEEPRYYPEAKLDEMLHKAPPYCIFEVYKFTGSRWSLWARLAWERIKSALRPS